MNDPTNRVHLDHNATTPMRSEVRECMLEALDRFPGNASSVHSAGRAARAALDDARMQVAAALRVHEGEVLFTSGGTESDNLALFGTLRPLGPKAGLAVTAAEHPAVLECALQLEREGHLVHRIAVDEEGSPRLDDIADWAKGLRLLSAMRANNEVGTLTDLEAVRSELDVHGRSCLLHTDAVQALGRVPLQLDAVDLATLSAHKVGGPVGVGVLVRRGQAELQPLQFGGGQEAGTRPGTENVAAIVAAARAIELAVNDREQQAARWREAIRRMWSGLHESIPGVRLLGPPIESDRRLPNTLNVLLPNVDGRVLVTRLDLQGLEASTGSACSSGSLEASHVLLAMGLDEEHARAGLRLSLGRETSEVDIHNAVDILRRTLG